MTAAPLGGRPIEVTLLRPPPIERELALDLDGDESHLRDGNTVIAVARPAAGEIDVPAAPCCQTTQRAPPCSDSWSAS